MIETAAYWPNVQAAWTVPREVVTAINVGVATGDRGGRETGEVAPPNPLQIANLLKNYSAVEVKVGVLNWSQQCIHMLTASNSEHSQTSPSGYNLRR